MTRLRLQHAPEDPVPTPTCDFTRLLLKWSDITPNECRVETNAVQGTLTFHVSPGPFNDTGATIRTSHEATTATFLAGTTGTLLASILGFAWARGWHVELHAPAHIQVSTLDVALEPPGDAHHPPTTTTVTPTTLLDTLLARYVNALPTHLYTRVW